MNSRRNHYQYGGRRRFSRTAQNADDSRGFRKCRGEATTIGDYRDVREIGGGTFGTVYEGTRDGRKYVLKKYTYSDEPIHHTTVREIKAMRLLNSPHVCRIIEVLVIDYQVYSVFPYYPDDLSKLLSRESIPLADRRKIFSHILCGIKEMHDMNFIHRDLKPSNVLIDSTRNGYFACVCDFGMTRKSSGSLTPGVVTLWYRAPELLLGHPEYGTSADVWSLGCILYEMLTGSPPFKGNSELEQLGLIVKLCGTIDKTSMPNCEKYPLYSKYNSQKAERTICEPIRTVSESAADLIDNMLVLDPDQRLTVKECLAHHFFKDLR